MLLRSTPAARLTFPLCMPFASTSTPLCVLAWTAVQPMFMPLVFGLFCSMPTSLQATVFLYYVCVLALFM